MPICYLKTNKRAPIVIKTAPSAVFQVKDSPKKIAANITTKTTESLSSAATVEAGPVFSAKK